jgi:hypothetical protein
MTATPEDLIECWHLLTADDGDPVGWEMDQAMWDAVQAAARNREAIDAGDHFADAGNMVLLGTPVEIVRGSVPILKYRSGEEMLCTPVLGRDGGEKSAAITNSHGRGTGA